MDETINLKGHVSIFKKENGPWEKVAETDNTIVTMGKQFIINKIATTATGYIQYFGVGSSLVGTTLSDTVLNGRADITSASAPYKAYSSIVNSGTKITLQLDLDTLEPVSQPIDLSEVGLFTAVSGGSMISKVVHTAITKNSTAELRYFYDLEVL